MPGWRQGDGSSVLLREFRRRGGTLSPLPYHISSPLLEEVKNTDRNRTEEPSPCLQPGINTVATDHCPFNKTDKDRGIDDFTMIPNGVMGVENLYPYMLSEANKGRLSFERVVELCSANPAKIFGCSPLKGVLTPGSDADIVLYDTAKDFTISQKNMHSNIDHTIWEGVGLKGYPVRTYSRGVLVYKDEEFLGKAGHGRFIERGKCLT